MFRRLLTRHALLVAAALVAVILVGTSVIRFVGARRAAAVVAMAEGDRLGHELARQVHEMGREAELAAVQAVVEREPGLSYVALLGERRRTRAEVGESPAVVPVGPPGMPRFIPEGVLMEVHVPPPGVDPPSDGPPAMRLLFAAGEAEPVRTAGTLDLGIGIAGGVGLLGLALGLWVADRRRERAENAAAEQAHLASLGEMSAVLAHEIRNPLAALKGHAQLLEEKLREQEGHGSAERVVAGAVRLERLVNDLLRFARSAELVPRQVDPGEVAYDALNRVAPDRIELFADEAPERAVLDPARIGQVLDNLLLNAVQASPEDAMVELHVLAGPRGGVRYLVRDRGPGVPQELRERLFEPFVTTRTRGTGLGLAVAYRLVQLHGGTLTVEDAPDGGALFTVLLPEA